MNDLPSEGSADPADSSPPHWPSQSVVARRSAAVGEGLPGDYALLDLDTGDYFSLGEVGGFVWDHLDGERSLGEVAAAVAEAFDVGEEQAGKDLQRFVAALAARRLVRLVGGE